MSFKEENDYVGKEPIAVIGSGFRFPGSATNPSKLWELLRKPRDLLCKVPEARFSTESFYHPDPTHHGTTNVTESYFLDQDHRVFDAGFFNVKPVEVPAIDPQQRLLMETIYESLEAAGLSIESLAGSQTGVYVGLMCADYVDHLNMDMNALPTYTPTGTARSIMSNRISYFFDWHGPCMTIDTACSSSLVAVHQAVQLLRSRESELAVAAGVNLILGPGQYIGSSKLHMLSADSRSRMWDAEASGYARGEGVAAVIMKRLSQALVDGDHIECVIRESGVNQDGRTKGITMPSQVAQADLITRTYAKAGLDPKDPTQRCQYFEAHGTGTGAGDPKEAEAISTSFFHPGDKPSRDGDRLYVGSIKTVLGHTEGTAGLAGVLKASLALQHGVIPPNLLFNKLHNAVEPFYTNLEVATTAKPWPQIPEGTPRRASVNSFGFGGTNAHIILENHIASDSAKIKTLTPAQFTPFVFSAASERSLKGLLTDYAEHLQSNPDINLHDLSYTLYARRTASSVRTTISATSMENLLSEIKGLLETSQTGDSKSVGIRAKTLSSPVKALGVFTGQGAQWPTMGKELVLNSPYAKKIVQDLDNMLQKLPEPERPDWSLMDQLTCDISKSRLDSAVVAQPLCTVIQVILFDLLSSSGVKFQAVVGHSSGEIAAAYAAGHITRDDAVKIAYYRGYFTNLAPAERPGAMMAVGTSPEDAKELCTLPIFEDRLCVAAINSDSSVTLSGDRDAVEQAKEILDEEKKFARVLKVDKAYHSSHMIPCSSAYIEALERCKIQLRQTENGCAWYSSTYQNRNMQSDQDLAGDYWRDNMVRPVLFWQAVKAASISEGAFDVVIEIGPHATLKGVVLQTLQESQKEIVPYTGLLHRGSDAIKSFSDGLGYLWSQFSPSIINFHAFDTLASGSERRKFVSELPTYHWDHDKIYWHETRATKAFRMSKNSPNPLLGTRTTDSMEQEIRWRNFLKLSELPWISGHQLQGQIIYPATAYISTVIEAAKSLTPTNNIALIEVQDFELGKPLVFNDDDGGIETVFTLSKINKEDDSSYSASFIYHGSTNADSEQLSTHATGKVIVILNESSTQLLPARPSDPPGLVNLEEERFYDSLELLGYQYSGHFKALSSIKRKLNFSVANIYVPSQEVGPEEVLLHPAVLDCALQGIFLAYCWPDDQSLDQLHVPTGIKSFRVNVGLCKQDIVPGTKIALCSHLTENPSTTKDLCGDVDIFSADGTGLVQIEGVKVVAFSEPTADSDRTLFSEHKWGVFVPDCELAMGNLRASAMDYDLAYAMERVSLHYMKEIVTLFPEDKRKTMNLEWHFECLFDFFTHVISGVQFGTNPYMEKKWLDDSPDEIAALKARHEHRVDVKLVKAIGDNLAAVLRGETTMLEHMTKDNLLNRFYEIGLGLKEFSHILGKTVAQVVNRYPRMKILEIGAGTGGATKNILAEAGHSFASYTYTDISTGFFETATEVFAEVGDKMIFKTLDVEKDITEQGYQEHSYDLVVASLVLHATTNLDRTLTNVRRLLKPGGYLVMQEMINNDAVRTGFLMCAMPGWWLGRDDGRKLSPCIETSEWHRLLLRNGFSGADSITSEKDVLPFPLTVVVSQAIDDQINSLREPLSPVGIEAIGKQLDLVVIGGQSMKTIQIIDKITELLLPLDISFTTFLSLGDLNTNKIPATCTVLCLAEIDQPIFERLSEKTIDGLKKLFEAQRTVLWITQGRQSDQPYMNMAIGLGRSLVLENPDLTLQFIDFESTTKPHARLLLEALFRLRLGDMWEKEGKLDTILWTNEQELVHENGTMMLSRIYHNRTLNDRYNASKRKIFEKKDPQTVPLSLSLSPSAEPSLFFDNSVATQIVDSSSILPNSNILIKVNYSLLLPVSTIPLCPLYVVLGTDNSTEKPTIAFSENNGSFVLAPRERAVEVELPTGTEANFISRLGVEIKAENILSFCQNNSIVLLHKPSAEIAASLQQYASDSNITIFFSTSPAISLRNPWIAIDAYSSKRIIISALPPNISVFIDCSENSQDERAASVIASCLPQTCMRTTLREIETIQNRRNSSAAHLSQKLNVVVQRALVEVRKPTDNYAITTNLQQLLQSDSPQTASTIVDWRTATKVPVQILTVDNQIAFKSNKTYILFGLTSNLAQSICDWMASRGARNIVMTSRSPKIDNRWIELLAQSGVRLEVFANDITDKKSLTSLVNHIRHNFPPIAGICHGAMVLDDTSFFEMPLEKMTKVLRPKVKGAIYLDELFQENTLDFFVFFSSVTCIAGNRGQSAYTTSNLFMSSLATQRRNKGLAASILHIGAVMGVGYINRGFYKSVYSAMKKIGFMKMPERGFHLCFAEAVLASHPRSGRNPEIITGLNTYRTDDILPQWSKFPRFQHCLIMDEGGDGKAKKKGATVSTKTRLAEAHTDEEIFEIVGDAFYTKLQAALQIPVETDKAQILSSGTDDLGIDSLVAVEIRSWFLKELEVELPVLKILSGGSVTQLLEYAVGKIPANLTPNRVASVTDLDPEGDSPSLLQPPSNHVTSELGSSNSSSKTSDSSDDQEDASSATSPTLQRTSSNCSSETDFGKIIPMSPGQSRFWFLQHMMADKTTANITIAVSVQGEIRVSDLNTAIQTLTTRHESLRTSFFIAGDQKPVQAISRRSRLSLEKISIVDESQFKREVEALKNYVYDIEHGECMRFIYLSLTPTTGYFILGAHHIIMDGISFEVFLDDLQRIYNRQSLPEPVYQYSEYSAKLQQELKNGALVNELEYWKSEYAEPPTPLPLLPFAAVKSRTTLESYEYTYASRSIDAGLGKQIKDTCQKLKANVFHFYLATFETLLFKLLNTSDICIGMADANRWDDQVSRSLGMYLNVLPLRFHLDDEQSFEAVLKETRRKAYSAMSNSRLPFDALLDIVKIDRSTAYTPLFQAFINYRQGVNEKRMYGNASVTTESMSLGRSGYDITLDIIDNPGGETRIIFQLQKQLYSEADTTRTLDIFFKLLGDFSSSTKTTIRKSSLFSNQSINDAITLGQGPIMPSKWPETLSQRIDNIIAKHPNKEALKEVTGQTLTYQQMEAKVSELASVLQDANVTQKSVVAVFQEPSARFVISLLAILQIGAIYVPLNSNVPLTRLDVILKTCKPSAILVDGTTSSRAVNLELSPGITILDVSKPPHGVVSHDPAPTHASSPAAVLFTSGTTGVPKGVILTHGGLRNHVEALVNIHGYGSETVLHQSSISFDISLDQIFMALANGGTLIILSEALRKDPLAVVNTIYEHAVTYTCATPSEYLNWFRYGFDTLVKSKTWKFATSCGEQFPTELLHEFRHLQSRYEHSIRVINAYGPSECAISSNENAIDLGVEQNKRIAVGKTLPNYSICIMDANLDPLPIEFPGEICITGVGVAAGYMNLPEESQNKFLEYNRTSSSFAIRSGWNKFYRTGDKGILHSDGKLEILGRIDGDTQIKLRGQRIELQDIEQSVLQASNGAVREVIVTPRGDPVILVAHAVVASTVSTENERQYLQQLAATLPLPQYMRPAAIIPIDAMPLTFNGKIDRKALQNFPVATPSLKLSHLNELSDIESKLVLVWEEVLAEQMKEIYTIDGNSDFFQVGGNSMLLIELRELLKKRFQVDLSVICLFENSSLGSMAAVIEGLSTSEVTEIDWEIETEIPPEFSNLNIQKMVIRNQKPGKTVVLTGATGLLGNYILRLLAESPEVEKIHCIAIRNIEKLMEFANLEKVVFHKGNLSLSRCGLSEAKAKSIFESADSIIHNGADVSFLKTYNSLKPANLTSTKELVKLSLPRKTPFHFISTGTAGKFNGMDTLACESLAAFPPNGSFMDGYAASKWASEVFLEKVNKRFGLPVCIHRPSSITGDETGETDIMSNVMNYTSIIKAIPNPGQLKGFIDLITIENAASRVMQTVMRKNPVDEKSPLEFLHHAGDIVLPAESIKDLFDSDEDTEWESVSLHDWIEKAIESGMNYLVGEFLKSMDNGEGIVVGQRLLLKEDES